MEEYMIPIGVYVKTNEYGYVTEVLSDIFIIDFNGWTKIDEGFGDKYAHAQGHYFDKPLENMDGTYNYILSDGKIVAL